MANSFSFNGTDMATYGVVLLRDSRPYSGPRSANLRDKANGDGAYAGPVRRGPVTIPLDVHVYATTSPVATAQQNLDSMLAIIGDQSAGNLILDSKIGRCWHAFLEDSEETDSYTFMKKVSLSFSAPDPFMYATAATETTVNLTTVDLAITGKSKTFGEYWITPASLVAASFTLENETSGESMIWAGVVPYPPLVIRGAASGGVILNSGSQDLVAFSGNIPQLLGGSTNRITCTGGTINKIIYTGRY